MWVGGVDVFSDAFALREVEKGVTSGNAQFSQDIAAWTFQETGVPRIDNTTCHRVGELPVIYIVNDQIVYTTQISKYDPTTSKWVPYSGLTDLQLEFTMLDTHPHRAQTARRKSRDISAHVPCPRPSQRLQVRHRLQAQRMVAPLKRNHRPRRPPSSRRLPPLPERCLAVLRRRDEHERGLHPLLSALARGRCSGREEGERKGEGGVSSLARLITRGLSRSCFRRKKNGPPLV